jgi:hypothetical protein
MMLLSLLPAELKFLPRLLNPRRSRDADVFSELATHRRVSLEVCRASSPCAGGLMQLCRRPRLVWSCCLLLPSRLEFLPWPLSAHKAHHADFFKQPTHRALKPASHSASSVHARGYAAV